MSACLSCADVPVPTPATNRVAPHLGGSRPVVVETTVRMSAAGLNCCAGYISTW